MGEGELFNNTDGVIGLDTGALALAMPEFEGVSLSDTLAVPAVGT